MLTIICDSLWTGSHARVLPKYRRSVEPQKITYALLTHDQMLEKPLRQYLSGLSAAERKRVIPAANRKRAQKKQSNGALTAFEREALKYLKNKQNERAAPRLEDSRILRMANALVYDSKRAVKEEDFFGLSSENARCSTMLSAPERSAIPLSGSQAELETTMTALQDLCKVYQKIELSTHVHHVTSRILKILIHHQFKELANSGIDNEARQNEMLERTGLTVEDSKDLRNRATGWLRLISVFGVGALAVVDAKANDE